MEPKENEGIYQHLTDNWKVRVSEKDWKMIETQDMPEPAREYIGLPIKDLIDLGW